MTKGFLLIDGAKNSVLIPLKEVQFLWESSAVNMDQVKTHATQAELFTDIKRYMKGEYENNEQSKI